MGCASSHSVKIAEERIISLQKTIDLMQSKVESHAAVMEDVRMRQHALTRQFMAQVSEHVSLCADFKTFIEIASENENRPQDIMERVESLETYIKSVPGVQIASGVKIELIKVQEQLHNLENSAMLDESSPNPSVLAMASELQHVQMKVLALEAKLFSEGRDDAESVLEGRAAADWVDVSGDSAEENLAEIDSQSDDGASEAALEAVFMKASPNMNRSSASSHDYDVAGVLDFALLEPEDAFEAEISSITARVHRHTQHMEPPKRYPHGFNEPQRNVPSSKQLSNREVFAYPEHHPQYAATARNVQTTIKRSGSAKNASKNMTDLMPDYGSEASD